MIDWHIKRFKVRYQIGQVLYMDGRFENQTKKPLHFREIQWGIYNTSSLKCNGFFKNYYIIDCFFSNVFNVFRIRRVKPTEK